MYNQFVYNTEMYNAPSNLVGIEDQDPIVFNGYSLQNASLTSRRALHENMPSRALDINDNPRNDGQFIYGDFYRAKKIPIVGRLKKASNSLLEDEIDAMKKALSKQNGILDIKRDNVIRRYIATLTNGDGMFDRDHYHVTFIPYQLEFTCLNPFGHSVNYNAETLLSQTSLVLNESMNNIGTTLARPVIILNFASATGVTAISFKNNTRDNEEIELIKNINAGDYVRFDTERFEVTVNGVPQDYLGSFPLLSTGANSITITITGSSATYNLTKKYLIPYL